MISFNVLDDLKQEREVLENFISQPKTKELIENLKSSLPSIDDLEKTLND